jgi:cytochrome P450
MFPPALAKRHMLNADPPDHTRLRGLVSRAFTARRMESLRGRIQEITDDLLAAMPATGTVELIDSFAFPLPITVICELLGVPPEGNEHLREMVSGLVGNAYFPDRVHLAEAASNQLDAFMMGLLAAKRKEPGDDLLSALIAAREDEWPKLNEEELIGVTFLLVIAGHETTVNLISNGVVALLRNPDQLAILRSDPGLLPQAIDEFLRYDGPIHHATIRVAIEDTDVDGVPIPAGSLVLVQLAAANRDPDYFADPDRLDVNRPHGPHLAFGHGLHFCLGAPLALLEAEIAIGSLLRHYPSLRLAVPPSDLHWRRAMTLRALEALPLEVSTGG